MGELEYWRLKSKLLESQMETSQAEVLLRQAIEKRAKLLADNSLESGKNYAFDDKSFSIEEVK